MSNQKSATKLSHSGYFYVIFLIYGSNTETQKVLTNHKTSQTKF